MTPTQAMAVVELREALRAKGVAVDGMGDAELVSYVKQCVSAFIESVKPLTPVIISTLQSYRASKGLSTLN